MLRLQGCTLKTATLRQEAEPFTEEAMSESKIRRKARINSFVLSTSTAVAETLPMFDMAGGVVSVGTMSTDATAIQLWVSDAEAGPFRQLYDASGAAANITLAPSTADGRAYALPDAVFAAQYVKLLSATTNSTGTSGIVVFKG
jgi:hypothetical protein